MLKHAMPDMILSLIVIEMNGPHTSSLSALIYRRYRECLLACRLRSVSYIKHRNQSCWSIARFHTYAVRAGVLSAKKVAAVFSAVASIGSGV